nr:RNA-directed DNA polymerase, eukaryota, reverse transcriptase zinc-binding domain protein [Tanacetum cinerariifolium]
MGRLSHNTDANDWTWIFQKNKDNITKPIGNPFQKDLEKVVSFFYVTNFQESINAKELWKIFMPYGLLADTFIANKRSKRAESPFTLDSTATYVDESPNVFNPPPQSPVYPCEFYENDAYYGHYCTPQAPFIYPEQCYNQDFNFPQDFQDVPQQYPCCDDCRVTHDAYQYDDSFSLDKIDYVEASPPNSKLVSLEVMEIVIPKVGGIKASNDNTIPFYDPIIFGTPMNLTPSGESDFFSE